MYSCTNERQSREMLVELEQFRVVFRRLFLSNNAYEKKVRIFVFDTQSQFQQYAPLYNGKPNKHTGYFFPGPLGSVIAYANTEVEQGLHAIFHEYVHFLVDAEGSTPPTFFNEGLAEAYSTFKASGDEATIGNPVPYHISALRQENFIPLGTLFTVKHDSPYYNESNKMSIFYAESWLVMHYLIFGQKSGSVTPMNMAKFFVLSDDPKISTEDACRQAFGLNFEQLQGNLEDYLISGKFRQTIVKIPAKPFRDKITSRPATAEECEIELAGLLWRMRLSGDEDAARNQSFPAFASSPDSTWNDGNAAKIQLLADKYPANPRPYEILAEIAFAKHDQDMALDCLRKAVARNSQNPLIYAWLLRGLYAKSVLPFGYILPDDTCVEYRGYVDHALALAPNCLDAVQMLALVESQSQNMRIKLLNTAMHSLDGMSDDLRATTLLALGMAYYRLKDYESAETALREFEALPRTTPALKQQADALRRHIDLATGKSPLPSGKQNRVQMSRGKIRLR